MNLNSSIIVVLALSSILTACIIDDTSLEGSIDSMNASVYGGTAVQDEEVFDAFVRIKDPTIPVPNICSGVAITSCHVLTAAHCFMVLDFMQPRALPDEKISAMRIIDRHNNEYEIEDWRINLFTLINNISLQGYDLAVLKVKPVTNTTPVLTPVGIVNKSTREIDDLLSHAQSRLDAIDDSLVLAGYGLSTNYLDSIGELRSSAIPFRQHFGLDSQEIHAGSNRNHACDADSGAGLILKDDGVYQLVGTVSRNVTPLNIGCADSDGHYYVYLGNQDVRNWVQNALTELGECSENPDPTGGKLLANWSRSINIGGRQTIDDMPFTLTDDIENGINLMLITDRNLKASITRSDGSECEQDIAANNDGQPVESNFDTKSCGWSVTQPSGEWTLSLYNKSLWDATVKNIKIYTLP